ncbi:MAG: enoyl-CoA hydratase-related protein, partial [Nevskiales bacterium]|nr:enoyl-CoA hydratase-related protein [Nevskiales bacterium]
MGILAEIRDRILLLQIDRPEKKNALSQEMYSTLADHLDQALENPAIRVLLLTGTHGCFTSGNDIEDFLNNRDAFEDRPVSRF